MLVGNIGRDPEIQYVPSGAAYVPITTKVRACDSPEPASSTSVIERETYFDFLYLQIARERAVQIVLPVFFHETPSVRDGDRRTPQSGLLSSCPNAGRSKSFFGSNKANKRNAP
jgi:hypothetical protein